MKSPGRSFLSLLLVAIALVLAAADWPRFRGPNGTATSPDGNMPVRWSDTENILWKTQLPGLGSSSPITHGDRIFLTCYSGYGIRADEPGQSEALVRHLVCVDRTSGRIAWQQPVKAKQPEDAYGGFITQHGYASSTSATDGERVYVFFGKSGVLAFDLEGRQLWHADVGSGSAIRGWGSAASVMLYKNLVIVNASAEGEAIVALDKQTGREVWKASSAGYEGNWSTPVLVTLPDGTQELAIGVPDEVWGLNPDTGKLRWYAEANPGTPHCASVVAADGVVYVVAGRNGRAVAVRAGGRGDVTETHVLWNASAGSNIPSALVHEGHLYWVSSRGVAHCLKVDTGRVIYEERLPRAGTFYASVVLADGKLYAVSRENGTYVLAASPKFEQLAHNEIETDKTVFNASPAVSDGKLLIRSNHALYCISAK